MKEFGIIVEVTEFEEGDIICHINNWKSGIPMFFKATDYDVEKYSGKNGVYLKLIQTSVEGGVETTPRINLIKRLEKCGCEYNKCTCDIDTNF
jgi:hypothetical protein